MLKNISRVKHITERCGRVRVWLHLRGNNNFISLAPLPRSQSGPDHRYSIEDKSISIVFYHYNPLPEWYQPIQHIFRSQRNASFKLTEVVVCGHNKLKLNINLSKIKILLFLRKIIPKVNFYFGFS